MDTSDSFTSEKVPNTLAAGIKVTGSEGEERGEEMHVASDSDPGGGRALGPPLGGSAPSPDRGGGVGAGQGEPIVTPEIAHLMKAARRTRLVNPYDRECSPEEYVDPSMARLADALEAALAERDALMALLVKEEVHHDAATGTYPPTGRWWVVPHDDTFGGDVFEDRDKAVASVWRDAHRAVRKAAGLDPDPKAEGVESPR